MSTSYVRYPLAGVQTYPNAASLPSSARDGQLALTLDTYTLYAFEEGTMTWVAIATPGASIAIDGLTGDVTASGPGVVPATISNGAVTNIKIADGTINLATKVTGQLPIANGGTGQSTASTAFEALSPLTTKGDLLTYDTANDRLPVGTDGYVLSANSGQTTGLQWIPAPITGITSINSDATAAQTLSTGTAGSDFAIVDAGGGGHVFNLPVASAAHTGKLSSTDWSTFNGKLTSSLPNAEIWVGNGIGVAVAVAASGDLTLANTGAFSLTNTGVSPATYGDASHTLQLAIGAKGRISAASSLSIQIAESQVTNLVSDLADKLSSALTSAHIFVGDVSNVAADVAVSGDLSLANTGAFTLNTVNSNVGSFGTASSVSSFTVNAKGLITAASNTSIQIAESQVTNLVSDLAGKQPVGNYITALTGDVTASGPGSVAATIANNAVTNAKLAQMPTNTIKGNNTGSTANAQDLTISQVLSLLSLNGFTAGSVLFANGSGLISQDNSKFFFDNTNFRLGIGTATPNYQLQSHVGSATAIYQQITNSATGSAVGDGFIYGIDASGNVNLNNQEASLLTLYTNNSQTFTLTADNRTYIGTTPGAFQTFSQIDISQNETVTGVAIGIGILPILEPGVGDNGIYYGLAVQPLADSGSNAMQTMAGAFFAVVNGADGTNGVVYGTQCSASYAGSGTCVNVIGAEYITDGGGATTTLVSGQFDEPSGWLSANGQTGTAINVAGTISTEPQDDTGTYGGTINALPLPTSFVHLNTGETDTLNGIDGQFPGKYAEIYNATGHTLTINNASGSAATGQQILTPTGAAVLVLNKHTARFRYFGDISSGNWLLLQD